MRQLVARPCRRQCNWGPTAEELGGFRVFACTGCGSEWTADQAWTPCNADGRVSDAVAEERAALRPPRNS